MEHLMVPYCVWILKLYAFIWTYFEPRKSYFWFRLKQIQLDLDNNKNDSSKHGGMVISPSFGDLKFILIKENQENWIISIWFQRFFFCIQSDLRAFLQ